MIVLVGAADVVASTLSVYENNSLHQITIVRDDAGVPRSIYFSFKTDLHRRSEAIFTQEPDDGSGRYRVELSQGRSFVLPPAGVTDEIHVTFVDQYLLRYQLSGIGALNPKVLKQIEYELTCAPDLTAVSNI